MFVGHVPQYRDFIGYSETRSVAAQPVLSMYSSVCEQAFVM